MYLGTIRCCGWGTYAIRTCIGYSAGLTIAEDIGTLKTPINSTRDDLIPPLWYIRIRNKIYRYGFYDSTTWTRELDSSLPTPNTQLTTLPIKLYGFTASKKTALYTTDIRLPHSKQINILITRKAKEKLRAWKNELRLKNIWIKLDET